MCPCCCCYWRAASKTSALGGIVQLKRLGLAAYPISAARERRSGMNRIGHPDWVKLCVELNCAPNQNTFCYNCECSISSIIKNIVWTFLHASVRRLRYFYSSKRKRKKRKKEKDYWETFLFDVFFLAKYFRCLKREKKELFLEFPHYLLWSLHIKIFVIF